MSKSESGQYDQLDRLAEEFAERFRRGERPTIEEYTESYPELAEEIRELFPAMVRVERADEARQGEDESTDPRATNPPPSQVGDYRILRRIGRGGMGVVYEAEQISLGRRVALKVLPGPMAGDRMILERFRREARAAARLHHTNIVPVYEVGQDGDVRFYAMQFIQGQGLDLVVDELQRLRDRSPSRTTAVGDPSPRPRPKPSRRPGMEDSTIGEAIEVSAVVRSILTGRFDADGRGAEASGAARSLQAMDLTGDATTPTQTDSATLAAISEDPPAPALSSSASASSSSAILPGGTQLSSVESARRAFYRSLAQIGRQVAGGLAYAHARRIVHRDIKPSNLLLDTEGVVWISDFGLAKGDDEGLTQSGDVVGTLRYMAPERFRGQADARADIYALGLTLYELLTLRPGFDSADRLKTVEQIKTEEPPRPRSVDARIPRDLETIVLKAIEKDPKVRYQTAEAMSEDLRRFLADEPIRARPVSAAEHYWRWARRNPAIAVLGGILTAVLLLATVSSFIAAISFNRTARSERAARHEAELSRQAESSQRQRAEREKTRADITLADAYTSRGLLAGERNAPAEAVLWFAAAADQSAGSGELRRQEDNRLRARNWLCQAILPVAAMAASGNASRLDFQPHRDRLLVHLDTGQMIVWSWPDDRRLPWADPLAGVDSAQFSPDGGSVALGFGSGDVEIRKVTSGERLARIKHQGKVTALAFSPDGKHLAIASRIARVWDVSRQAFLNPGWSHPQQIHALAFNRKANRLITACGDKLARVFAMDGADDRRAALFPPVVHVVRSAPALVDDDRILVTVSGGSELRRWDMATGKPVKEPIHSRASALQGVVASPDGHWFVTGGYYGPELYAVDGRQPPVYLGHTNLVRKFACSPDNTVLLSASMDLTARLWSVPDGRPLCAPLAHMAILEQCAWSHDSRYIATAEADGLIRVWKRPVDSLVIARETGWGQRPRVSFDGRLVVPGIWHEAAVGGAHQNVHRVRVVGTADGKPVGADISVPGDLVDSCVCADNLAVAAVWSRGKQGQLGVWDVATARGRFEPIALPGLPLSVAARPGNGQLAVICSTGDLLVIDDKTGKSVLKLRHEAWKEPEKSVQVQYSPDGKTLVSLSGGNPATVNVRDAESGQLRFGPLHSTVPGSNFHSFSLSADSRLIATISLVKNAVQVWDLDTGQPLSEPLPHPGDYWGLFSVRFSPDGRYLLTGHKDGQDRYWDWRAAKLVCPPVANDDETHDVAITPDGRFALTVMSGRPELQVWEWHTGRRVAPPVRVGSIEGGWCHTLAITPDGRRALVGYSKPSGITESSLAVVDLEALLSPPGTATADLSLLSELATARHIELGDLSGLTTDQWQERWDLLHQRNPGLATSIQDTKRRIAP